MPIVEVKDQGVEIEFPDSMSGEEIGAALQRLYPPPSLKPITGTPQQTKTETEQILEQSNAPKPYTGPDLTFQEFKDLTLEMLTSGPLKIPKIERKPEDKFAVAAAKDFVNEISGVPEFFSSPVGVGLLAATKGHPMAGRAVAGGFALTTLYDVYKDAIHTLPNLKGASESEFGGFAGRMIAKGLFATALSKQALGVKATPVSPLTKAADNAEASNLPATAQALREQAGKEAIAEHATPPEVSPVGTPEGVRRGGVAATPEVTAPVAGAGEAVPATPPIEPTTTVVEPSQGPLAPAPEIGPGVSAPPEPVFYKPEGEPNAPRPRIEPEGNQPEHIGIPQGENVPAYAPEVRQEEGGRPSGSGGNVGGTALERGEQPPRLAVGAQGEVRGEVEQRVLTFDDFAALRGVSRNPPSFPEYHRKPGGVSKPTETTASERMIKANDDWQDQRDALRKEYDDLVSAGEIRPPTRLEVLRKSAEGEGEAAEAAKRLLKKYELSQKGGVSRGQEAQGQVQVEPALVGMGAAVPGEFARGQGSPTAMKMRQIDAERQKRGLEPLAEAESVADQVVWDRAMAEVDRDPSLPERLVRDLTENPRPIHDWENHVLLIRKIELKHELDRAARDAAQAYEDGRLEDMDQAKERWDEWSNRLTALEKASRMAGTERGRALRALRVMANEDFSLAALETRRRMAKGGEPLTDAERAELVKIADEWQKTAQAATERAKIAEQAKLEAETARLLAEARTKELEATTGGPTYELGVIRIAERIVSTLDRRADAARKRLRERLKELGAGPNPAMLYDLAEIGASHIGHIGLDFAKWSVKMAEELGEAAEKLRPYFKQIFDESQKIADERSEVYKGTGKTDQIKKAVKKVGEQDAIEEVTDKIRSKVEKDELAEITPLVQKLGRALVAKGITDRNVLVDEIHRILQSVIPDITRRETMEAMAGYGDFKPLSKDEISVKWRDVRGQLQQVLKLEDLEAKRPLPRMGIEQRVKSDTERRLVQQVNEAKKKYGVVVTDPERQLKSALDARKTAIRNRISDLEYEIKTRQRIVKSRTAPPTDTELEALIAERDRLKAEHEQIFTAKGLTNEQRLRLATAAAERAEKYWQERLANAKQGKFDPIKQKRTALTSPEIEAIRTRIEATKAEIEHLKELANPKATPDQIALKALKSRMQTEAAKLAEKIAENDYTKRKPSPVVLDEEAIRLRAKLQQLRNVFEHGQYRAERASWGTARKVWEGIGEAIDTARAIKTSFDLSAVLRQGAFFAFGHPIKTVRAMKDMFRAIRSEQDMLRVNEEIMERPNFKSGLYHQSKLYLADQFGRLGDREEAYMAHWSHKISGVAASERAYVTFLNRLRADMFDLIVDGLRSGEKPTLEEAKAVAHFVNVATGRGEITQNYAVGLNRLFFSPRFVISRFQTLLGEPILRGKGARLAIAKEYGRTLAGIGALYVLAQAAGFNVSFDPRSSDFGKIRIGKDVRLDPMAGIAQSLVFLARLWTGQTKNIYGKVTAIRGPGVPYRGANTWDVITRFIRSKLAPTPGAVVNVATGKNPGGDKTSLAQEAVGVVMPMLIDDVYQTMQSLGVPKATALSLLALFGMSVQNYSKKPNLSQELGKELNDLVKPKPTSKP